MPSNDLLPPPTRCGKRAAKVGPIIARRVGALGSILASLVSASALDIVVADLLVAVLLDATPIVEVKCVGQSHHGKPHEQSQRLLG